MRGYQRGSEGLLGTRHGDKRSGPEGAEGGVGRGEEGRGNSIFFFSEPRAL